MYTRLNTGFCDFLSALVNPIGKGSFGLEVSNLGLRLLIEILQATVGFSGEGNPNMLGVSTPDLLQDHRETLWRGQVESTPQRTSTGTVTSARPCSELFSQ